jgi:hypothetical protein
MDGMLVRAHHLSTGGRGNNGIIQTIPLEQPTSVIAQISLSTFDSFGANPAAFAVFTGCTTTGVDGLPPVETFGPPPLFPLTTVLIRNGLTSLTYSIEISNCRAFFIVNLFFWPSVTRR